MKTRFLARFSSAFLMAVFCLPSPAYALRPELSPQVKAGIEEDLRVGVEGKSAVNGQVYQKVSRKEIDREIPWFLDRLTPSKFREQYPGRLVRRVSDGRYFLVKSQRNVEKGNNRSVWPTINSPVREYIATELLRALGCNVCDMEIPDARTREEIASLVEGSPDPHFLYLVSLSSNYSMEDKREVVPQKDPLKEHTRKIGAALLLRLWDIHSNNVGPLRDSKEVSMMFDAEQAFHPTMEDPKLFMQNLVINYFELRDFIGAAASTVNQSPQQARLIVIDPFELTERIEIEELKAVARDVVSLKLEALEREVTEDLLRKYGPGRLNGLVSEIRPIFDRLKKWQGNYLQDASVFFDMSSVGFDYENVKVKIYLEDEEFRERLRQWRGQVQQVLDEVAQELAAAGTEQLFVGTAELLLDGTNRLSLPAKWKGLRESPGLILKRAEGEGFRYLEIYPERDPGVLASGLATLVDSRGRVRIREEEAVWAEVGWPRKVVLLGVGSHMELWNKQAWEKFLAEHSGALERYGVFTAAGTEQKTFEFSVPPDLSTGEMLQFVHSQLEPLGLPIRAMDAAFPLAEYVSDGVDHGKSTQTTLQVSWSEEEVRVTVRDNQPAAFSLPDEMANLPDPPEDPEKFSDLAIEIEAERIKQGKRPGGYGILLTKRIMSQGILKLGNHSYVPGQGNSQEFIFPVISKAKPPLSAGAEGKRVTIHLSGHTIPEDLNPTVEHLRAREGKGPRLYIGEQGNISLETMEKWWPDTARAVLQGTNVLFDVDRFDGSVLAMMLRPLWKQNEEAVGNNLAFLREDPARADLETVRKGLGAYAALYRYLAGHPDVVPIFEKPPWQSFVDSLRSDVAGRQALLALIGQRDREGYFAWAAEQYRWGARSDEAREQAIAQQIVRDQIVPKLKADPSAELTLQIGGAHFRLVDRIREILREAGMDPGMISVTSGISTNYFYQVLSPYREMMIGEESGPIPADLAVRSSVLKVIPWEALVNFQLHYRKVNTDTAIAAANQVVARVTDEDVDALVRELQDHHAVFWKVSGGVFQKWFELVAQYSVAWLNDQGKLGPVLAHVDEEELKQLTRKRVDQAVGYLVTAGVEETAQVEDTLRVPVTDQLLTGILAHSPRILELQASLTDSGIQVEEVANYQESGALVRDRLVELLILTPEEAELGDWRGGTAVPTLILPARFAAGLTEPELAALAAEARGRGGILHINDITRESAEGQVLVLWMA